MNRDLLNRCRVKDVLGLSNNCDLINARFLFLSLNLERFLLFKVSAYLSDLLWPGNKSRSRSKVLFGGVFDMLLLSRDVSFTQISVSLNLKHKVCQNLHLDFLESRLQLWKQILSKDGRYGFSNLSLLDLEKKSLHETFNQLAVWSEFLVADNEQFMRKHSRSLLNFLKEQSCFFCGSF